MKFTKFRKVLLSLSLMLTIVGIGCHGSNPVTPFNFIIVFKNPAINNLKNAPLTLKGVTIGQVAKIEAGDDNSLVAYINIKKKYKHLLNTNVVFFTERVHLSEKVTIPVIKILLPDGEELIKKGQKFKGYNSFIDVQIELGKEIIKRFKDEIF